MGRFVSTNVVNLSRKVLSQEDLSLLSKGLKFSPTPKDINKGQLKADIEDYKRRMRLRWFFKDKENNSQDTNKFKVKSSWQPPICDL